MHTFERRSSTQTHTHTHAPNDYRTNNMSLEIMSHWHLIFVYVMGFYVDVILFGCGRRNIIQSLSMLLFFPINGKDKTISVDPPNHSISNNIIVY